ncbi:MAG: ABC transporter ATP-binding protein [Winogradskyella sp.]|nr:ABC transporter ATP-binding protein [Winogradskyella sp.]
MLQVKGLTFSYFKTEVLQNICFILKAGENLCVIGESGSGKSTLLKLIYGEYDLDEGEIYWKDQQILGPKYNLVIGYDFMKYVAQEFDLMPFVTVSENIGKHLSNFYPEEKQDRINELIEVVELQDFANTKVKLLSGGQKQRVALARTLAKQPEIILLDEPFSHIDNFKKQSLRRSLFRYLKAKNISCIVATHDKADVLGFADRMIVLNDTKIIANEDPQTLYKKPRRPLIASFFDEFNYIEPLGLVYAHQLIIVSHSGHKAVVKTCYFNGRCFLIEATYKDQLILLEHKEDLDAGTIFHFKIEPLN